MRPTYTTTVAVNEEELIAYQDSYRAVCTLAALIDSTRPTEQADLLEGVHKHDLAHLLYRVAGPDPKQAPYTHIDPIPPQSLN